MTVRQMDQKSLDIKITTVIRKRALYWPRNLVRLNYAIIKSEQLVRPRCDTIVANRIGAIFQYSAIGQKRKRERKGRRGVGGKKIEDFTR